MARFFGSDEATVDEKGRFPLPVKFRRTLETIEGFSFHLQPGLQGEILAIPSEYFETIDERRADLDPNNVDDRAAAQVYGEIESCALDKAGRMTIPPLMRSQFGIDGSVIVSGAGPWLLIWKKAVYEARTALDREKALAASSQRKLRAPAPPAEA
ncbi:MAG: division/cell wall cluster transcriptional repressor MraZ [bacterium]